MRRRFGWHSLHLPSTAAILIPVALASGPPGADGDRLEPATDRECSGQLRITQVATVGSESDLLAPTAYVLKVRGNVLSADAFHGSEIAVFDSGGGLLQTVGRRGDGRGEYQHIRAILLGASDTVHVFDVAMGRRVVLSPRFEVVRMDPAPFQIAENGVALLGPHDYVMNGYVVGRDGYSLHLVDRHGRVVRSFGDGLDGPWGSAGSVRPLTHAHEPGHFWAARHDAYRLELWSTSADLVRTLSRTPDWWTVTEAPPDARGEEEGVDRPLARSSRVVGVQVDADGRLIVISRTPSDRTGAARGSRRADWSHVVIDALSPSTGELLGSCRIAHAFGGPAGRNHLFTFRELQPGRGIILVWRIS